MGGVMGSGSCHGTVKSFNPNKGYGFITMGAEEIFVHFKDCVGGMPQQGDQVAFEVEDSPAKPGTKKASNVSGGTGNLNAGKDGGGYGAWADMAAAAAWFGFAPYGFGKGKG